MNKRMSTAFEEFMQDVMEETESADFEQKKKKTTTGKRKAAAGSGMTRSQLAKHRIKRIKALYRSNKAFREDYDEQREAVSTAQPPRGTELYDAINAELEARGKRLNDFKARHAALQKLLRNGDFADSYRKWKMRAVWPLPRRDSRAYELFEK